MASKSSVNSEASIVDVIDCIQSIRIIHSQLIYTMIGVNMHIVARTNSNLEGELVEVEVNNIAGYAAGSVEIYAGAGSIDAGSKLMMYSSAYGLSPTRTRVAT